jgi:hypothetical protein
MVPSVYGELHPFKDKNSVFSLDYVETAKLFTPE